MKSNDTKYPFTLSDISDLLDLKLSIFSDKSDGKLNDLKIELSRKIDRSATGIIAEMDKRFAEVNDRFDEVDIRFDRNDDVHQEILGTIDEIADKKIEKHVQEKHPFLSP